MKPQRALRNGDILEAEDWYSGVRSHYYQVIKAYPKDNPERVTLRPIYASFVATDKYGQVGFTVPMKNRFEGDGKMTRKIDKDGWVRIDKYHTASLWDGTPGEHWSN